MHEVNEETVARVRLAARDTATITGGASAASRRLDLLHVADVERADPVAARSGLAEGWRIEPSGTPVTIEARAPRWRPASASGGKNSPDGGTSAGKGALNPNIRPIGYRAAVIIRPASIDQGAEVPHAFMSIQRAFVTYSEGMTRDAATAQPWDPGACRCRKDDATERLLFEAGVIDEIGSRRGTTQTDSAGTRTPARDHDPVGRRVVRNGDVHVNLTTPQHPDFIAEVERVLSADGASS
jgi:hypothetical protein